MLNSGSWIWSWRLRLSGSYKIMLWIFICEIQAGGRCENATLLLLMPFTVLICSAPEEATLIIQVQSAENEVWQKELLHN